MALAQVILLLMSLTFTLGQRGSFAGTKPIGFPELLNKTTTTKDGLGDRFGEGDATTQKIPLEALGDKDLVDRLSKLPQDHQSFWLLNAEALEAHRQKPQVYPQRPSSFAQPLTPQFVNPNPPTSQNFNAGSNGNTGAASFASGFNGNPSAGFTGQPAPQNFNSRPSNQPLLVNSGLPNGPNSGVLGNLNPGPPNNQNFGNPGFFPGNQGSGLNGNINGGAPSQNFGFNRNPGISMGNRNGEITPNSSESQKDKSEKKVPIKKN